VATTKRVPRPLQKRRGEGGGCVHEVSVLSSTNGECGRKGAMKSPFLCSSCKTGLLYNSYAAAVHVLAVARRGAASPPSLLMLFFKHMSTGAGKRLGAFLGVFVGVEQRGCCGVQRLTAPPAHRKDTVAPSKLLFRFPPTSSASFCLCFSSCCCCCCCSLSVLGLFLQQPALKKKW
jgi:hypothetical protein